MIGFGVKPSDYWEYSLAEVMDLLESFERRERRKRRERIRDIFLQAEIQTRYLAVSKDTPVPYPWEYYPELFAEDQKSFEVKKAAEETEACRISRKVYAREFNKRRQHGL